jgi:DNA-binding response OmpR family regulator
MQRIILIEDNERMAALVASGLRNAGISADIAATASEGAAALRLSTYSAIVLDRGLPDGDGLAWLGSQRRTGNTLPCLILTARDALHDRVDGLESGADDYLAKPFSMVELVARVRALLRRPAGLVSLVASWQGLQVDPAQSCAQYGAQIARLSEAETQVLLSLVRANGAFLRRSQLEAAAWGLSVATTTNALDVVVYRLRTKLARLGAPLELVVRRGVGYALAGQ